MYFFSNVSPLFLLLSFTAISGASPPIAIESTYNPFRTVHQWFLDIYPTLLPLDQPPLNGDIPVPQRPVGDVEPGVEVGLGNGAGLGGGVSGGYRPLECVQRAGDIMYVPAGWSHSTMNIGG